MKLSVTNSLLALLRKDRTVFFLVIIHQMVRLRHSRQKPSIEQLSVIVTGIVIFLNNQVAHCADCSYRLLFCVIEPGVLALCKHSSVFLYLVMTSFLWVFMVL